MSNGKKVIQSAERFVGADAEYIVKIKVTPTFLLLWAVIKAGMTGKTLNITHTFNCNPFEHPAQQHEVSK